MFIMVPFFTMFPNFKFYLLSLLSTLSLNIKQLSGNEKEKKPKFRVYSSTNNTNTIKMKIIATFTSASLTVSIIIKYIFTL